MRLPVYVFILYFQIYRSYAFDPCDSLNHADLHDAGWRGSACKRSTKKVICDRYISSGGSHWYTVKGDDDRAPRKMVEGPVSKHWCGTDYPIYLPKGEHPTTIGELVTRNACMRGSHQLCEKQYRIQIKKCASFFVYNLTRTESCNEAYCFGEMKECQKPDPCEADNRQILSVSGDRTTSCKDKEMQNCDSSLKHRWFRPMFKSLDVKMPTKCIQQNSCGTVYPIYLKGTEPTVEEKVVDRKACVNTGTGSFCNCGKEYDIQVKNCTSFLVYNLTSTTACPERYCFGSIGKCHETQDVEESLLWKILKYFFIVFAVLVIVILVIILIIFIIKRMTVCQPSKKHNKVNDTKSMDQNQMFVHQNQMFVQSVMHPTEEITSRPI